MEDMQKWMVEALTGQQNDIEELKNNFGIPYGGSEDAEKIDLLRDRVVGIDLASGPDVTNIGGHAVTIVGENEEGLVAENSWGEDGFSLKPSPIRGANKDAIVIDDAWKNRIIDPSFDSQHAAKLIKEARKRKEKNKMAKQSRKKNRK